MNLAIELVATRHRAKHRLRRLRHLRPGLSFLAGLEPLRCWERDCKISVAVKVGRGVGEGEGKAFVGGREEKDFGHVLREKVENGRVVVEGKRGIDVVNSTEELVEDSVN